jgi:hypothetical protein
MDFNIALTKNEPSAMTYIKLMLLIINSVISLDQNQAYTLLFLVKI